MTPDTKPAGDDDRQLGPEMQRHMADPAEKTEEVSDEQERARKARETPTQPGASTDQQPT